ncbi:hypothetical protein OH491_27595 (plasmid) [Termitidicoccus mucosus]|uniref:hypothetical protein n=1 Tax=Termitidicoccus mucosus TaxID=1184151 RepID=UPI003182FB65
MKSYYRAILKQFENQYDQHYNEIKLAFGDGVNVEPMNKRAHQLHTYLFSIPIQTNGSPMPTCSSTTGFPSPATA